MSIAELFALIAGSNVLTAAITTWMTRGLSKRSVKVDEFKVITDEWAELHAVLTRQLGELSGQVNLLKGRATELERSLGSEQKEHETTRRLLRAALRHIRDVVAWSAGDQSAPIPAPPDELLEHF